MIRKIGYSCHDQAVENLTQRYSAELLELWRRRLTELYQVSKHPSALASMRLVLSAYNRKTREAAAKERT